MTTRQPSRQTATSGNISGTTSISFVKMNGLGNDFAILDGRTRPFRLSEASTRAIANRETGIGCDQVIVLEHPQQKDAPPTRNTDVFMRILNADGSEVAACGNASRCVAVLLGRELGKPRIIIDTLAGRLEAEVTGETSARVDMGQPGLKWHEIPLSEEFHDTRHIELEVGPRGNPVLHSPSVVSMGNPHCIFWVENVHAHDLASLGPFLEHHPLFPERANISLAELSGPDELTLRVWERGAGETLACGTSACAAAVAAARKRLTGRRVRVNLPGGTLLIDWRESDDHVLMTGPVTFEYDGALPVDEYGIEWA